MQTGNVITLGVHLVSPSSSRRSPRNDLRRLTQALVLRTLSRATGNRVARRHGVRTSTMRQRVSIT